MELNEHKWKNCCVVLDTQTNQMLTQIADENCCSKSAAMRLAIKTLYAKKGETTK